MGAVAIFGLLALAAVSFAAPDGAGRWQSLGRAGGDRAGTPGRGAGAPPGDGDPRALAEAAVDDVPLLLELLGAALDAGLSLSGALELVARVATPTIRVNLARVVAGLQIGASWEHSWAGVRHVEALAELHAALGFAALTGAPAAPLLYAEAAQRRRQAQRGAEKRAAALGVKLVVPLGLCSLPAFLCLGVVPVVLAMIPTF